MTKVTRLFCHIITIKESNSELNKYFFELFVIMFCCLGHVMLNADMLKQNYGMKFNTQIELFSNNKAKTFNCNRISIA